MEGKKIIQINSGNHGSTGSIMLDINSEISNNNLGFVAYANSRTNKMKSPSNEILIGSILERNIHLKLNYLTGYHGRFSKLGTKKFINILERINPDIIHLHNLHSGYVNLELLFNFIKSKNIPVVWTLHDCWPFTGHCPHFTFVKCEKWKTECFSCPQFKDYPATIVDKSNEMYHMKKKWFKDVENLTIVTPSNWLAEVVKDSFLKDYPLKVINNGIDLMLFKPTPSDFKEKYKLKEKKIILGVANPWTERKGLNIFVQLSKLLNDYYQIVLVGLTPEQIQLLPENIIGIEKTSSKVELAEIYSAADVFLNPSIEETMGLVTIEAIACGTPAIVSNSTANPEMVNDKVGVVTKKNSVEEFYELVTSDLVFKEENLLDWAKKFSKKEKYDEYLNLYNTLSN